ncbi:hypothetical protein CMMCAS04_02795 [Clavibacter michiganensis subsp. michiganensis]|nr:hypothetical protein CMMCAS04_02795 [Clavibacter michiganensis subsp. michiganensis]
MTPTGAAIAGASRRKGARSAAGSAPDATIAPPTGTTRASTPMGETVSQDAVVAAVVRATQAPKNSANASTARR